MSWSDLPCKEWQGSRFVRGGYGQSPVKVYGTTRVHRIEWIKHYGVPPADKPFVLHRCDNPACYEITHLFVGTQGDNMADKQAKGRHHNQAKACCPRCGGEYTTNSEGKRRCLVCDRTRRRTK